VREKLQKSNYNNSFLSRHITAMVCNFTFTTALCWFQ